MLAIFTAPVKFYSTYPELIPAPRGFDTTFSPLEASKWQHFPIGVPSKLSFSMGKDMICHIVVTWNGRTTETVKINLLESARTVQFTAHSPAISCKYIVLMGSGMFLRRFQVSLTTGEDFDRLSVVLSRLRLAVKPARPPGRAPGKYEQPNFQAKAVPITKQSGFGATPSMETPSGDNTLLESQYATSTVEQGYDYPICSQVVPDTPWQSQSDQCFVKPVDTQTSKGQDADQMIHASQCLPLLKPKLTNQYQAKGITQRNPVSKDKSIEIDVELTDQNMIKSGMDDVIGMFTKSPDVSLNNNKHDTQPLRKQSPKPNELRIEVQDPQVHNKECLLNTNRSEKNVLGCQRNIPSGSGAIENGSKALPMKKGKQWIATTEKEACDPLPKDMPAATAQKIRISKRLIKEKLKDEYFMKWVSKVEETLSGMTDLQ